MLLSHSSLLHTPSNSTTMHKSLALACMILFLHKIITFFTLCMHMCLYVCVGVWGCVCVGATIRYQYSDIYTVTCTV